jgi:predicted transcriptional regulator
MDKRIHRNQSLAALGKMSFAILQTVLAKLIESKHITPDKIMYKELAYIKAKKYEHILTKEKVSFYERPPMITVKEYRERRGIAR